MGQGETKTSPHNEKLFRFNKVDRKPWCGVWESNPHSPLAQQSSYHWTNTTYNRENPLFPISPRLPFYQGVRRESNPQELLLPTQVSLLITYLLYHSFGKKSIGNFAQISHEIFVQGAQLRKNRAWCPWARGAKTQTKKRDSRPSLLPFRHYHQTSHLVGELVHTLMTEHPLWTATIVSLVVSADDCHTSLELITSLASKDFACC